VKLASNPSTTKEREREREREREKLSSESCAESRPKKRIIII
jgi:hypothetical protein